MSERTPSEINRRLAEYAGYLDIEQDPRLPGSWTGHLAEFKNELVCIRERTPNYWTSADAVLPLVERVCRERGFTVSTHYKCDGSADDWLMTFWLAGSDEFDICHGCHTTLPAAICLALVAVLDGVEAGGE